MLRRFYLATLVALQFALAFEVAPRLARVLRADVGAAGLHLDAPAFVGLGAVGVAAVGLALILIFPAIALARHHQRGEVRFRGLPRWAIAVALTGAAILVTVAAMNLAQPFAPADARTALSQIARPAATAGTALMAAGALCAELLRRSIAPWRHTVPFRSHAGGRVEVIDPPELRTRAA